MKTQIDAILAGMPANFPKVGAALFNLGTNDFNSVRDGTYTEAAWESDLTYMVDAIVSKYPGIRVYVARPWRLGYDAEANTVAGWIATVVASRPAVAALGMDERAWMSGAGMSTDGVHYSDPLGRQEAARQWLTVLGY